MARLNEIEKNNLTDVVIKLSATKSTRQIADILEKEHNVKISSVTIGKYVKEVRESRADATKDAIAQTVTPGITSDLEYLDQTVFKKLKDALTSADEPRDIAILSKEIRELIQTKIKLAGGSTSVISSMSNDELIAFITGQK